MAQNYFNIPGYNPLGFNPQMPYSQVNSPLAQTSQGPQNFAPNYINSNQQQGKQQYQAHSSWQFGLNYNQIAFSSAVQGVGAYLRENNQRKDFNTYNRLQNNPLSQLPQNGNTSQQALYGDKVYKRGGMKKYDIGGPGPGQRPTSADSLALYNNAMQVQKYYNNPNYTLEEKTQGSPYLYGVTDSNNKAFDRFRQNNGSYLGNYQGGNKGIQVGSKDGSPIVKQLKDSDYRRDINQNQYFQRETANSILDMNAPMSMFDKRINPQVEVSYANDNQNDKMFGDRVNMYQYDPIAVKPFNMLTPQERQQRIQTYGAPPQPKQSAYQAPRSAVNSQVQNQGSGNPINSSLQQSNVAAGQSGPYSFTGRIGDGTQATQFFNDSDVWRQATDQYGYTNRDQTVNGGTATGYQGTGAHLKKGGNVKFEQGGKFDDFDNFDEDDFQDLKDELDKYFNDKGEPQETKAEDLQEAAPKTETKTEDKQDEDSGPSHGALDFLNSDSGENGDDDKSINDSDKDIADQLSGKAPIPQIATPPADPTAYSTKPTDELTAFKRGIAQVESAGYGEGNKNSSAFGKYQFTAPTREGVRAQYFPDINKVDFENAYKSDPQFQERVMDVYGNHLLQTYKDPHKAALAFYLGPGKANYTNQPDYNPGGGNVTVGKYLQNFDKGYGKQKQGGHIQTGPGHVDLKFGSSPVYKQEYEEGGEYEMSDAQIELLRYQGYKIDLI